MLTLKRTSRHFKQPCSENDYVVLEDGKVVGRIMLHPQAPEGQPWFWTITAIKRSPSRYGHGYSPSREVAMANFKARWLQSQ